MSDSESTQMEESLEPPSKKRNLSSNSDIQSQTGPAGHSLFDSLKLGGEGDRLPVELIQTSEDSSKNENSPFSLNEKQECFLPKWDQIIGPTGRSIFESFNIDGRSMGKQLPFELLEMCQNPADFVQTNVIPISQSCQYAMEVVCSSSYIGDPINVGTTDNSNKEDSLKIEESTKGESTVLSSEDSALSSSSRSQRRSQRAIKRKKFDDEVVSTEPGVISATAAAAAGPIPPLLPGTPITTIVTEEELHSSPIKDSVENCEAHLEAASQDQSAEDSIATPPQSKRGSKSISALQVNAEEPTSIANIGMSSPATTDGSPSTSTSQSFNTPSTKTTFDHASALRSLGKGVGKNLRSRTASMNLTDAELAKLKKSKAAANKKNKKPNKRDAAFKDLGRWKPTDDLALITSVLQTNDLHAVHRGIKFSCHFTYNEVQTRWQAIMFKSTISKLALQAIKNLHPEVVLSIQRRALLSSQERDLLGTIKSNTTPPPTLSDFANLLAKHPTQFHHARTPRCLQHHWQGLKQYTLLPDQSVQPYVSRDNHILNFLDAEASIAESIDQSVNSGLNNTASIAAANVSGQLAPGGHDLKLFDSRDDVLLDLELAAADRRAIKEIRHLEADIQKWQILVDKVRGDNPPDFDNQTLAVLRGRLVRYLMRSKEITLGRTAKGQKVDVDLKLEGPAWKISRRQGVIKLKNSGEFYIANEGKRSIFVDGKPIRRGCRVRLNNNSVLEIAGLKFVFLINQDLIEAIRQEANKMYQNS